MTTKTLTVSRVAADPSVEWHTENELITDSDPTFEQLQLVAKTLVAYCKISVELFEDSAASNIIETVLSAALANELDRACLLGQGGTEPTGITNDGDVQRMTGIGAVANYNDFSYGSQLVYEANGVPGAVVMSPNTFGVLDRLADQDDNPLVPPASYQALKVLPTSQIPTDLGQADNETLAVVGDFNKLLVGIRTSLMLEVSRDTGFDHLQVHIRAYLRADCGLVQPTHFVVLEDISTEAYTS